ncbi:purine-nucleoside phosphorylase [Paenibacillus thiaminolyticus]|uniref:Purine nucleoside phosphorylase n=1 Tax=Paenibacillus thiaminolyticus TaxID=49283 RepID=A0AAP9DS10_PANTH|nr:purine-nucleoside phosphorylase [Paenibacillus thiaminolyticus]MCY9538582.1 purine-nucleoside phosphorylase [Paenibacillus thiaminolyticus]MCY9604443.1 purine-nucleoside phosphorylase [Paenibacillus thiaminolyticus]MCY9609735.1 purine-nucleoside phosphorylase [Paenibacillus thiaminolyticus]MCY9616181.1 purine-nucleoside phosphorylase [Paenibacillus thiaminolyticus]MCY9617989.1 purine-nucleoside phosphorylase [Paenibacillus thiaminolyticus]
MSQAYEHIQEAASYIQSRTSVRPEIGLILGSGLGVLADLVENPVTIPYREIPHFPVSTVEGHAGDLLIGTIEGRAVVMMKGRFHMYEGYGPEVTAFPVRVMKAIGAEKLLVTNAAGGINTSYEPGDLMVISDHLNMTGRNPLIGSNDSRLGVRFPDMSQAYSPRLRQLAKATSDEQGFSLREGVYAGLLGPNYETPAEIRMLRTMGADAVGMSTVSEVIVASHAGLEVLGISCISNMAAGILDQPLSHDEVMETADKVKDAFLKLVLALIPKM